MLGKAITVALIIFAAALVALFVGLRIYDSRTREELSSLVSRELPVGADDSEMDAFMREHTTGYNRDDRINFQYNGLIDQTKIDNLLYRKVSITLNFDPQTRLYKDYSISIYYTWL